MYDWAFSLPEKERPADHIIDDDYRFDEWLQYYMEKQNEDSRKSGKNANKSGKKTTSHKTVFNNF